MRAVQVIGDDDPVETTFAKRPVTGFQVRLDDLDVLVGRKVEYAGNINVYGDDVVSQSAQIA